MLAVLLEAILPLVPELTDRLVQGIRVLDLGCGRGMTLMKLAARFPANVQNDYWVLRRRLTCMAEQDLPILVGYPMPVQTV